MTIKRRLFISNILMLVIPVLLTSVIFVVISWIFTDATEVGYDDLLRRTELEAIAESWTEDTDIATAKADLENFKSNRPSLTQEYYYLVIFAYVFVITGIVLTSRLSVRFVIKSVIAPIDALVYGVNQIKDGNLQYRIEYERKDEFTGICSDFNEMAQHLSDLVAQQQRDETSRKELIAGISHDLRTPLTGIKAYVEGLELGVAATPRMQKKYLDTIQSKAGELERIINQLFMFSKIDIGEFPFNLEKLDINEEVGQLAQSVHDEYEKNGLIIAFAASDAPVFVSADAQQLRNAITNIIENSLKYRSRDQGHLNITVGAQKDFATIELTDDGPGVPAGELDSLFDVFYRGDPARSGDTSGSGLGLAITSKILSRMGGSIRAENVVESGLRITLTLPLLTEGKTREEDTYH